MNTKSKKTTAKPDAGWAWWTVEGVSSLYTRTLQGRSKEEAIGRALLEHKSLSSLMPFKGVRPATTLEVALARVQARLSKWDLPAELRLRDGELRCEVRMPDGSIRTHRVPFVAAALMWALRADKGAIERDVARIAADHTRAELRGQRLHAKAAEQARATRLPVRFRQGCRVREVTPLVGGGMLTVDWAGA